MSAGRAPIRSAKSVRQRSDGWSQSAIQSPVPSDQAAMNRRSASTVGRGGRPYVAVSRQTNPGAGENTERMSASGYGGAPRKAASPDGGATARPGARHRKS